MGLFRLWLIPEGKTAADGVYVHYPFDELMAILAIEANAINASSLVKTWVRCQMKCGGN